MNNERMQECIDECWKCRTHCQETLFNYCLEEGGKHVESRHIKLMTDCIQICQIAADFMTRNSELHIAVCKACAEICEACAKSCEDVDDEKMKECAKVCLACAETCREMAKMGRV